jgi:hypothetical protein
MRRGLFRAFALLLFPPFLVAGPVNSIYAGLSSPATNVQILGVEMLTNLVPEPGALILVGLGMIVLGAWRRKRT